MIHEALRGPGRFLGCVVGVRVIDGGSWYGEGEVKVFRDGDTTLPTICGTGLEDYVGTAYGMGAHATAWQGAPLDVRAPGAFMPDFVGFYRWHVPDPIVFARELRVTLQQIGFVFFGEGQEEAFARYAETNPVAGQGWTMHPRPGLLVKGIAERRDDVCATSCLLPRCGSPCRDSTLRQRRLTSGDAVRDRAADGSVLRLTGRAYAGQRGGRRGRKASARSRND